MPNFPSMMLSGTEAFRRKLGMRLRPSWIWLVPLKQKHIIRVFFLFPICEDTTRKLPSVKLEWDAYQESNNAGTLLLDLQPPFAPLPLSVYHSILSIFSPLLSVHSSNGINDSTPNFTDAMWTRLQQSESQILLATVIVSEKGIRNIRYHEILSETFGP